MYIPSEGRLSVHAALTSLKTMGSVRSMVSSMSEVVATVRYFGGSFS
jgi:hypothetical protein